MLGSTSCDICTHPYDNKKRMPLMLHCNHMMCQTCLEQMTRKDVVANIIESKCPFCKTGFPNKGLQSINNMIVKVVFKEPVVPVIPVVPKVQPEECTHENNKWVCLDPRCKKQTRTCGRCLSGKHEDCSDDFFELLRKLRIVSDPLEADMHEKEFPYADTVDLMKNEIGEIQSAIGKFRREINKLIKSELGFHLREDITAEEFIEIKDSFEFQKIEEATYKIYLKNSFMTELDEINAQMNQSIEEMIQDFRGKLNFHFLKSLRSLRHFKSPEVQTVLKREHSVYLDNAYFLSKTYLTKFVPKKKQSIAEYLDSVENYLRDNEVKLRCNAPPNISETDAGQVNILGMILSTTKEFNQEKYLEIVQTYANENLKTKVRVVMDMASSKRRNTQNVLYEINFEGSDMSIYLIRV